MIPWKQCLRQGVICSYDKNTNLVTYFIGSVYRICICGYYNIFLLLIVGSVLFIAAGYVAYPKWFKSNTLICLTNFLKALPFMAFFHLLLMLSGDIEMNPGPMVKANRRTAKSKFISDLNTDESIAHSDPKELATKYHVSVRRWLRDCLPLRFTSHNPFF